MTTEANRQYPLETGGALMGYLNDKSYVVTSYIGPGPNAIHSRTHFQPDYAYQEQRIADIYQHSGRRDIYLGDWHSHPNDVTPRMSSDDRRVLANIAGHRDARIDRPMMIIIAGEPSRGWVPGIWCGQISPRLLWFPRLDVHDLELRIFD